MGTDGGFDTTMDLVTHRASQRFDHCPTPFRRPMFTSGQDVRAKQIGNVLSKIKPTISFKYASVQIKKG